MFGSGRPSDLACCTIALIISNDEMNDFMKIVKYLKESDLLIKNLSKKFKNKANK